MIEKMKIKEAKIIYKMNSNPDPILFGPYCAFQLVGV